MIIASYGIIRFNQKICLCLKSLVDLNFSHLMQLNEATSLDTLSDPVLIWERFVCTLDLNDNISFFSRATPNETLKLLTAADIIHFVIDKVIKKAYDFFHLMQVNEATSFDTRLPYLCGSSVLVVDWCQESGCLSATAKPWKSTDAHEWLVDTFTPWTKYQNGITR